MSPKVSVIIPAFNAAGLIAKAIASLRAQTFRDFEVIVVDDASLDATGTEAEAELAMGGLPHRVIRLPANGGPSAARNAGVREARGEYVAFLDADDVWLPQKLERQVALLDANPQIRLCGCQAEWVDEGGRALRRLYKNRPTFIPDGWKALLWDCYVATPCAVVRRSDLGSQPFQASLRIGEDRDLWIRLASNGSVALVEEVMVRIKESPTSFMARNASLIAQYTKPMIEKHIQAFSDTLTLREKLRIRGKLYSDIGKGLCSKPGHYARGGTYLLMAAALRHRPLDNLRFAFFTAPGVRHLKKHAKDLWRDEALWKRLSLGRLAGLQSRPAGES
jgi:glycosyltransferase involved in cell wall biosynthesis